MNLWMRVLLYWDDEDEFVGIVTRKELLKRINFMVHELTREYDFVEKNNKG